MPEVKIRRKDNTWFIILGVCLVIVLIAILFLNNGGEKYTNNDDDVKKIEAIVCTNINNENPIFRFGEPIKAENKIKVFFEGGFLSRISYNYDGEYENAEAAEVARAMVMADYNKYMGEHNRSAMALVPTYSNVDKTMTIDLVAERDDLDVTTAKFFYLDSIEYSNIKRYSVEKMMDFYQKKDFSCKEQ